MSNNNQTIQPTNSQPPLPTNKPSKWLPLSFLAVALIGFADATYLTVKYYIGETPQCSLLSGCETVLTSQYAALGPIPTSLLGAIFYLTILILTFAYLDFKNEKLLNYSALLTIVGIAVSAILVYLQIFVIGALCEFCLVSATTSTILFILAIIYWKQKRSVLNS